MPEQVFGKTVYSEDELEEILTEREQAAATKARQETEQKMRQQADDAAREQAERQYGVPTGAGGGTPVRPGPRPDSFEADEIYFHDKLRRGHGLQDPESRMRLPRWMAERLKEGIRFSTQPGGGSYRSFSPDRDKRIADDRSSKRGGLGYNVPKR